MGSLSVNVSIKEICPAIDTAKHTESKQISHLLEFSGYYTSVFFLKIYFKIKHRTKFPLAYKKKYFL